MPINYVFSKSTGIIFICTAFLSHYIIDIYYSLYGNKNKHKNKLNHYPKIQSLGLLMMGFASPATLYKAYTALTLIKAHGYLSIYNGELDNLTYPSWTSGSGTLFLLGYLFVLFSYPSKKIFLCASFIYMATRLFSLSMGSRIVFCSNIIAVIYFYSVFYKKKIVLKNAFILFVFIISISIYVAYSRDNKTIQNDAMLDLISLFFYSQGNTISVPLIIIEMGNKIPYHHYPFIFSQITVLFLKQLYPTAGQSQIALEKYNLTGHILTYMLAPESYYRGNGIGSSVLGEMYDCGGFLGIIFWSIILAMLFKFIKNKILERNIYILFCWFVLNAIIVSPRSALLKFFGDIPYIIASLFLILLINFFFYPKKLNQIK
jgi:oligosaccharide repeat unit polymerase